MSIGASGGNFDGSKEQLRQYLEALAMELGTRRVVLYPDAGAVLNRHMMLNYRQAWELFREWGFSIAIAWWGQRALSHPPSAT